VESNYLREPKLACGVQEHEDARTSHPCERRARRCKATCGGGRGKFSSLVGTMRFFGRCVMSSEERVKAEPCTGTLNGCLVEGDPEKTARERKIKRCAIAISVALQTAGLAVLVIAPLLAKPADLTERISVPIPPYGHRPAATRNTDQHPDRPMRAHCVYCAPTSSPPTVSSFRREDSREEGVGAFIDLGTTT
jgi:hypothetical protein